MTQRQNQLSADPFGPLFENFFGPLTGGNRLAGMLRAPAADVVETERDLRVVLELPGVAPEDVSVDLENNVLTVVGEKQERRGEGEEKHTWHLMERRYGRFTRSFVLPRDVDQDAIEADFEHGVLTITIPKSEKARRRRIEIRGANGNGGPARQVEAKSEK